MTPSDAPIQEIRAIAGRAARLWARAKPAAPVLPSLAQERPLRPASSPQVSWRAAFWLPGAVVQRARAPRLLGWDRSGEARQSPESFPAFQIQTRNRSA